MLMTKVKAVFVIVFLLSFVLFVRLTVNGQPTTGVDWVMVITGGTLLLNDIGGNIRSK